MQKHIGGSAAWSTNSFGAPKRVLVVVGSKRGQDINPNLAWNRRFCMSIILAEMDSGRMAMHLQSIRSPSSRIPRLPARPMVCPCGWWKVQCSAFCAS